MQCKLQNMQTTARGTSIVNVFVQEDRIITPAKRETMLINPVILGEENANTIYQASRAGEAGLLLDTILAALQAGTLAVAVVLDIADSASSNKRSFRIFETLFNAVSPTALKRLLFRFCRCDGHMLHAIASSSLTRSAVANCLHSAGILLRAGQHRWGLHRALDKLAEELIWAQGGDPRPEDRESAENILQITLLRDVCDETAPDANTPEARRREKLMKLAHDTQYFFNGNWRDGRLAHRCRLLPTGSFCCRNRSTANRNCIALITLTYLRIYLLNLT